MTNDLTLHCKACSLPFPCDEAHLLFLDKVSPLIAGRKFSIPPPTLCAACRLQRRLAFRNPATMGWRTCAASGKRILSAYPLESRCRVIENSIWWGDSWSGLEYDISFDTSRSFFEQLAEVRQKVPYAACRSSFCENCEYCSNIDQSKDCYFTFNTLSGDSLMYGDYLWGSKDCLDCTRTTNAELCYDCTECPRCYNLQSSEFCSDCRDSVFLSHCRSCSDCFGCWNLSHKRFHVYNKQLTEEQYREFLSNLDLSSYLSRSNLKADWLERKRNAPRPHQYAINCEDCSGNYLSDCVRVQESFFVNDAEDLRYCFVVNKQLKNCYDYSHFGNRAENIYECQSVGHGAFQLLFCVDCVNDNSDMMYCINCVSCHDCFGCVGLKKQRYCFLNRQYPKREYEALVAAAIESMSRRGEWGEFFPMTISPYPYNISFAQRYFPLNPHQAHSLGLDWHELPEPNSESLGNITELSDSFPASGSPLTVRSQISNRPFRITALEIERCRSFHVPLPRDTYLERMERRWAQLGGIQLYERTSAQNGAIVLSSLDASNAPVVWEREEWEKCYW